MAPDGITEFNTKVIAVFRANQGCVGGILAGTSMILIHHIGAKSGIQRVTPLAFTSQEDGSYLIVASIGGSATHPSWYYNLKAHPRIEVEVDIETFPVLTQELQGTAHDAHWPTLAAAAPAVGDFQTKTARRIPIFVLTRDD